MTPGALEIGEGVSSKKLCNYVHSLTDLFIFIFNWLFILLICLENKIVGIVSELVLVAGELELSNNLGVVMYYIVYEESGLM